MPKVRSSEQRMRLHKAIHEIEEDAVLRMEGETNLSTTYLAGKPGCGKTMTIRALARERGWGLVTMNISMETVERFGGIPDLIKISLGKVGGIEKFEYQTVWSIPEVIINLREMAADFPCVICFLDDWHLASPNIQQLGFELFTDYSIRGHKIPKNVVFALAGNDSPAAGARTHFSAIMNRVSKILVDADFDHWRDKFAIPSNVHPAVISFLERKEYAPHFHGEEDTINPWPSPRSWTNYSTKLTRKEKSGSISSMNNDEQMILCGSFVGAKAAAAFQTYYQIYSKFNVDEIFRTGRWKIPSENIDRFAFGAAISAGFYDKYGPRSKRIGQIFSKILSQLHEKAPEVAISAIRYIAARDTKMLGDLFKNGYINATVIEQLKKTSSYMRGE